MKTDYYLFIRVAVDGPLGCFQLGAITNSATMNVLLGFVGGHTHMFVLDAGPGPGALL